MSPREKIIWNFLLLSRAAASLLDLAGIFIVGWVATSYAYVFGQSQETAEPAPVFFNMQVLEISSLPAVMALVLALFLSKSAISILLFRKSAILVAGIEARASKAIAEKLFSRGLSALGKTSREDTMYAIQVSAPAAFNVLLNSLSSIVAETTLFLAICIGFFFVSPIATVAAILYFGTVALVIHLMVGKRARLYGASSVVSSSGATREINNLYAVFREAHVAHATSSFVSRLGSEKETSARSAAARIYLRGIPRYVIESSLLLGLIILTGYQTLGGNIIDSAATLGVFLAGGFRLTGALIPLQASLLDIKYAIPQSRVAISLLEEESGSTSAVPCREVVSISAGSPIGVQMKAVNFSYPGQEKNAIQSVSLEIQPGEQVALVGPSGAGKSTLADLLVGLLQPNSGSIMYTSLAEGKTIDQAAVNLGYVPQKPGMISGSILNNIALTSDSEDIDVEFAKHCLDQVGLLEKVNSLNNGINSEIGNLQDSLSGGQLQRLGLARALYNKPSLLILDEPTSSLDAKSESDIISSLNNLRGKVTIVIIAHRLNSIRNCDRVFFIQQGSLIDSGSLKELSSRNPELAKMIELLTLL